MREKIIANLKKMAGFVPEMIEQVYTGLMQNQAHYLDRALNKERIMDDFEEQITNLIVQGSKDFNEKEQKEFALLGQVAQNIERMGDEIRSLAERIEIKIAENLFFSDIGIKQYLEVFESMRQSVNLIVKFLDENDQDLLNSIIANGDKVKELVEEYRKEHMLRLAQGICEARAANMYFDMLDFTGNIARHCTNIARIHKER